MLNLTSSNKTSEMLFRLLVQSLQTWVSVQQSAYISILVQYCMGISLSVRQVDQQQRQLAVRFYAQWYCARRGVDALARRFRLALNRHIFCESANIKVCLYQVMSNGLFEETNEQNIFSKVLHNYLHLSFMYSMFNEKLLLKRNI